MKTFRLRSTDLAWREVEGEIVAVDMTTSTYLSANGSGQELWEALADGATREQLVGRLVAEYGIDPHRAGADVDAFVSDLESRGLLEGT